LLLEQQELTVKKVNIELNGGLLDAEALQKLIDQNLFDFIKITHNDLNVPLLYENQGKRIIYPCYLKMLCQAQAS
jgi:RNase E specificity factor CsrD